MSTIGQRLDERRCRCLPGNPCLACYGKLSIPERRAVLARLGITGDRPPSGRDDDDPRPALHTRRRHR